MRNTINKLKLNAFNFQDGLMTYNQATYCRGRKWTLIFAFGLVLTGCGKFSQKTPQEHLDKAREYLDAGDLISGSIELKTALQQDPQLLEARRLLGETDLALGKGAEAEKELRQAMALGLVRGAALPGLAESLELQGKSQEILDEVTVEPSMSPPEQARIHVYRGDALTFQKKFAEAQAEYEEALGADAAYPLAKLGLARVAIANNDLQKAERLVEEAIATAPDEARLWSFRGDFFKAKGDLAKALESYTKAIENRRQNFTDRGNRALVLIAQGKYADAAADANILKQAAPNFFMGFLAEGLVALAEKDYVKAQTALEESLKRNPNYLPAHYFLAYAYLMQDHPQQAEQSLVKFLGGFPDSAGGYALMALTKIRLGDYDGARKYADPLYKFAPNDSGAVEIMSIIKSAKGDDDAALKLLEKATLLDPKAAFPQLGLGLGLLGKGEKEKGLAALEAATRLDETNTQSWTLLALTEIQQGQFDKARKTIDGMKARQPDAALPLNLEGVLYTAQGQGKQADECFQAAWDKEPGDPTAGLNLAVQAMAGNKPEEARGYLEKILQIHPDDLAARLKMVELDAALGKYAEVETRLADTVKQFPEAMQPRVILARHFNLFRQPQRALTLLQEIASKHRDDPIFMETYTQVLVVNRQAAPAMEAAKAWVGMAPKSGVAHYWLARAYAEGNQAPNAVQELDRALAIDRALLPARIMKVQMLARDKPDEASRLLEELRRDQPDNVEVLNLAGWLARQRNQLQASVLAYQAAFDKAKTHDAVINLVQVQWLAGHQAQAAATLEAWRGQYPQDWPIRIKLSGMYAELGKEREALAELEGANKAVPANPYILNELAWRLRESDRTAALDYAEKAYRLAPSDPSITDTLATLLLDTGSKERALRLLREARDKLPENLTVRYHYASALAEVGEHKEAGQEIKGLLAGNRPFPERAQAEALLQKLSAEE
jgi:putative PEP-CTERM system TPR-repeat lipoprotein